MRYCSRSYFLIMTALLLMPAPAGAQSKGEGSFRLEYQYIRTGDFDSSLGDIDIGRTDGHTILASVDYALTDRWNITASLPWVIKRHTGALPHDPENDITTWDPPNTNRVDDEEYHSNFQDIYVGTRYLLIDGPLSLQSYIAYGLPTNDYQVYGHAAVGRNRWHIPVGVTINYLPYFSDWHINSDIAYVFTQKTQGVDISHWLLQGTLGYYLTPSLVPNVFVSIKYGSKGLDFPDDYDVDALNDKKWYYHDRMIKHNFINAGVGLDWILSEKHLLSLSAFKMVKPDQVNVVDVAATIGITRYF